MNALVTMVQVDKCAPSAASAWTKRKPPKVRRLVPVPTSTSSSAEHAALSSDLG